MLKTYRRKLIRKVVSVVDNYEREQSTLKGWETKGKKVRGGGDARGRKRVERKGRETSGGERK